MAQAAASGHGDASARWLRRSYRMQLAPVSLLGYSLARARAGARVKLGTAPRRS